ncbi:hypothetical protein GYB14_21605 [bacterium]|nr:hypothetical protein [bacterium]
MNDSMNARAFADIVIAMTDGERRSIATAILEALSLEDGVGSAAVSWGEAQKHGEALLHVAKEIEFHEPGGQDQ